MYIKIVQKGFMVMFIKIITTLTQPELNEILREHEFWLAGVPNAKKAIFNNVCMMGLDFSHRIIREVEFRDCECIEANFSNTDISQCKFINCDLHGAIMEYTKADNTEFKFSSLSAASLYDAQLRGVKFIHTSLDGMQSIQSDFTSANIFDCSIIDTKLFDCSFNNAVFMNTDIPNLPYVRRTSFANATFTVTKLATRLSV